MFYIYANGKSIFQPMDNTLSLFAPKLTLEMGKAGSLQFQIPPSNKYYNALPQLTTTITVEMDDVEIFRGRVLSNNRNFNNVRTVYCEGNLAYLVDSVQKAEKYEGKAHELFRKIIEAHNARVEAAKQFTVGNITIEDRDVLLVGKSDSIKDAETGKFDYKQIALNSIAEEWMNTFEYIESSLIDYTGGYLRTRRVDDTTYIDLLADYGTTAVQEIEFGKNLLDLTEEVSAEDIFTVLIPLGDENLTIESVNDGSDELADANAVARYGRIVKTHVFDSVNNPSTLLENAQRYLASNVNAPITITAKAVDMHMIDPNASPIYVGSKVHVISFPHNMFNELTCTKIEYDMENPANNTYTFGTPKQSLTERYRKDKTKGKGSGGKGAGGAGGAGAAADEEAKELLDEFFDAWINVNPEAAHIDLGTLYKKFQDGATVLESSCGISLDAPSGNINIKTLRSEFDELGNTVKNQSAYIDLLNNDLGARITAVASAYTTLEERETASTATITARANDLEAAIETNASHLTTVEGRVTSSETSINQISNDLEAVISAEATHEERVTDEFKKANSAIELVANNLKSEIDARTEFMRVTGETLSNTQTQIKSLSTELRAQITSETSKVYNNAKDDLAKESSTLMKQISTNHQAVISAQTEFKNTVDGQLKTANNQITSLSTSVGSLISFRTSYESDIKNIATISLRSTANESAIKLKADKTTVEGDFKVVKGRLTAAEASIDTLSSNMAKIDTLISDRINAITFESLLAKANRIIADVAIESRNSITAPNISATNSLTVGGKPVMTSDMVNTKLSTYATQEWVNNKKFLTELPSDITATNIKATSGMSIGIYKVATQYWCMSEKQFATQDWVKELLKSYAESSHTHTWDSITGKPSSFKPASHKHKFSGKSGTIQFGHTHKVTVNKVSYTTGGASTNYSKTIEISGTTESN